MTTYIDQIPEDCAKFKVFPELVKALEYSGLGSKALKPIIHISSKFSTQDFDTLAAPIIIRLFGTSDKVVRIALCENLALLSKKFNDKIINEKIFPNLVNSSFINT